MGGPTCRRAWEGRGRRGKELKWGGLVHASPYSQGLLSLDGYVLLVSFWTGNLEKSVKVDDEQFTCVVQSNPVNMDTVGAIESNNKVSLLSGSPQSGV